MNWNPLKWFGWYVDQRVAAILRERLALAETEIAKLRAENALLTAKLADSTLREQNLNIEKRQLDERCQELSKRSPIIAVVG